MSESCHSCNNEDQRLETLTTFVPGSLHSSNNVSEVHILFSAKRRVPALGMTKKIIIYKNLCI